MEWLFFDFYQFSGIVKSAIFDLRFSIWKFSFICQGLFPLVTKDVMNWRNLVVVAKGSKFEQAGAINLDMKINTHKREDSLILQVQVESH